VTDRLVYKIHNVGVFLGATRSGRPPEVAETLQRQLGGFESADSQGVEYRIVIADYDQVETENGPSLVAPGYALSQDGLFIDQREKLAFRHAGNTLFVWAARRSPLAVTYLLQILLLPQGRTLVHAAGVSMAGRGLLFPALGGVGKTALVARLLERPDIKLLGDDYVVLGTDGALRGLPVPFTLYPYHRALFPEFFRSASLRILPGSLPFRAARRALDALGLWRTIEPRLPVEYAVVPARRLYPPARLESSPVQVHAVYAMQRVRGLERMRVRPATVDEVSTFAGNVLIYEWHPFLTMLAAQCTLSGVALSPYLQQVRGIVADGLRRAVRLGVIELPLHLTAAEVGTAVAGVSLAD